MGYLTFPHKNPRQDARNTARLLTEKQWLLLNRLAQIGLLLGCYSISNHTFRLYFTMKIYLSGHFFSPNGFGKSVVA